MQRDDYDLVTNALDCSTGTKILNIALVHSRDSVQLHFDPRDDPDDIGYAVVLSNDSARALGEALIRHAAS